MKHGGKRPGAGRPKGSINKISEEIRLAFLELVTANMDQIKADLLELSPYERLRVITGLLGKVLPTKIESTVEEVPTINFQIEVQGEEPEVM